MTIAAANGSATATVETLTAEVRTLMVGSVEVALDFGPEKSPIVLNVDDMEDRHAAAERLCSKINCDGRDRDYWHCHEGEHCTEDCHFWDHPRDYRDEITHQVEAHVELRREDRRRVEAATELPLIVLAGLR
jgi:hypothetical protein